MELRVLHYFLTLTREGNISAAAEYLHVTQPTLSRQLMELEKELGARLFIRGRRKITLTEDGLLLKKRAGEILELVEKTGSEIAMPEGNISGNIAIGGGETHAMRLIADVIKEMQYEHPNIRVDLYSGNAEDVTERLDKGLLDFGVLIEPADVSKYESLRIPAKDVWGILMRKDSPLAGKKAVKAEDLWTVPLLTSRQRLVSKDISRWIKRDYDHLNIVGTYNLIFNASLLVEKGVGYALCLDNLVYTGGESALCFRPLEPALTSGLDIVWKKYQVFSKAAELFLQKIKEAFAEIEKTG